MLLRVIVGYDDLRKRTFSQVTSGEFVDDGRSA
jgi:hypothetical protein